MTARRRFIGLAAVASGKWNPIGAFLATLLVASPGALQFRLQGSGYPLPDEHPSLRPHDPRPRRLRRPRPAAGRGWCPLYQGIGHGAASREVDVTGWVPYSSASPILRAAGIPCGPINSLDQVLADPHTAARNLWVDMDHPSAGRLKTVGVPIKLSGIPRTIRRPPPALGEHTAGVLGELGLSGGGPPVLACGRGHRARQRAGRRRTLMGAPAAVFQPEEP